MMCLIEGRPLSPNHKQGPQEQSTALNQASSFHYAELEGERTLPTHE